MFLKYEIILKLHRLSQQQNLQMDTTLIPLFCLSLANSIFHVSRKHGARQSSPVSQDVADVFRCQLLQKSGSCHIIQAQEKLILTPGLVHFSICAELRVSPWTTMKNRDYFGGSDFDITGYLNVFSLTRVLGCRELIVTHFNMIYSHLLTRFWQKHFSEFSNLINSLAYSCSSC